MPKNPLIDEQLDPEEVRDKMLEDFDNKTEGLKDNVDYYDAERRPDAIGIAVPREMRKLIAHVGYPRLFVDSISERLEIEGFRLGQADEADEELWDWWQANDLDIESSLGHTEALIHGRAYVTVSMPDPNVDLTVDPEVPLIRVESPSVVYAEVDPRTRMVTKAIRRITDEDGSEDIAATVYLPDQTVSYIKDEDGDWQVLTQVAHGLGIVPVVPLINQTRISDFDGTSAITPELRSITDATGRLLMDMQATAELMAIPQRLLFGVTKEELGVDVDTGLANFDAYLARILAFEDADAKAQQFIAAELRNFSEGIDALDRKAAAYTGLPPQYLSFSSQNPASADAIKASESRLVKIVERKARVFGGAWEKVMRIAYQMMQGGDIPPEYLRMETIWSDPATPTYAAKADAAAKLYANGVGVIPRERAWIDMGYSVTARNEMRKWAEEEDSGAQLVNTLTRGRNITQPDRTGGESADE